MKFHNLANLTEGNLFTIKGQGIEQLGRLDSTRDIEEDILKESILTNCLLAHLILEIRNQTEK